MGERRREAFSLKGGRTHHTPGHGGQGREAPKGSLAAQAWGVVYTPRSTPDYRPPVGQSSYKSAGAVVPPRFLRPKIAPEVTGA